MHRMLFLPIANDVNLRGAGLTHALSGTLVTSANVFFTVVLSGTLTPLPGQTWPSSMSLVNSEQALWVGPLINSLVWVEGQHYQVRVTVDAGEGMRGFWKLPITAVVREE